MLTWPIWLAAIAVSFAALETRALVRGTPTLSRWVWTVSKAWPPFPFVCGFLAGFLACHFWWGGIVSFAPVTTSSLVEPGQVYCGNFGTICTLIGEHYK